MSKIEDLIKKLKVLADRGENGERQNAENLLNNLLKKHNISLEDLEEERSIDFVFQAEDETNDLFMKVVSNILGSTHTIYGKKWNPNTFIVNTTPEFAVEIQSKFDFYSDLYKRELKAFYGAFIIKNHLFASDSSPRDFSTLSEEELELYKKRMKMAEGMDSKSYFKQLQK